MKELGTPILSLIKSTCTSGANHQKYPILTSFHPPLARLLTRNLTLTVVVPPAPLGPPPPLFADPPAHGTMCPHLLYSSWTWQLQPRPPHLCPAPRATTFLPLFFKLFHLFIFSSKFPLSSSIFPRQATRGLSQTRKT